MSGSIVTIQVGNTANCVGTHLWNLQSKYLAADPGIPGSTRYFYESQQCKYPRVVIHDLAETFRSVQDQHEIDSEIQSLTKILDPNIKIINQQTLQPQSDFISKNSKTPKDLLFWSDFSLIRYQNKSLCRSLNPALSYKNLGRGQFEKGQELFREWNKESEFMETNIRWQLEMCDSLEGLQFLSNSDDVWSGFTSQYILELRDWGLKKTEISLTALSFSEALSDNNNKENNKENKECQSRFFLEASRAADIFTPVSLDAKALDPFFVVDVDTPLPRLWAYSALPAIALDTLSLVDDLSLTTRRQSLQFTNPNQTIAFLNSRLYKSENDYREFNNTTGPSNNTGPGVVVNRCPKNANKETLTKPLSQLTGLDDDGRLVYNVNNPCPQLRSLPYSEVQIDTLSNWQTSLTNTRDLALSMAARSKECLFKKSNKNKYLMDLDSKNEIEEAYETIINAFQDESWL